jgi:hypothetical protein
MGSSSRRASAADEAGGSMSIDCFDGGRAAIDDFVVRHFTWPGTLRLHGVALGWDILRAPVNVVLSLVLVLTRIVARLCRLLGFVGVADWLFGRRILLRTAVARRVEALVLTDLLDLPGDSNTDDRDASGLADAIRAAPHFRAMLPTEATTTAAEAMASRIIRDIGEYAGARSAVAEVTMTLCVIVTGALAFQALTPGMISMAPDVAGAVARTTAIADFPLGQRLGGVWYSVFAPDTPPWLVAAAVAGLIVIGAICSAFAGIFADPVQSWLGIHRRRLRRLMDTIERQSLEGTDRPFVAREHFLARTMDFWDAFMSVLRLFRG